jgi:anti-sigma-K factor RskA
MGRRRPGRPVRRAGAGLRLFEITLEPKSGSPTGRPMADLEEGHNRGALD